MMKIGDGQFFARGQNPRLGMDHRRNQGRTGTDSADHPTRAANVGIAKALLVSALGARGNSTGSYSLGCIG